MPAVNGVGEPCAGEPHVRLKIGCRIWELPSARSPVGRADVRDGVPTCRTGGQFERMIPLWFVPWPTASTVPPLEAGIAAKKRTPAGWPGWSISSRPSAR